MSDIEERAEKEALHDAGDFWDSHEYIEIIQKFVYIDNKVRDLSGIIKVKEKSGDTITEKDYESFYYYKHYGIIFERWITCNELKRNGYSLDKNGKWVKNIEEKI